MKYTLVIVNSRFL